MRTVIQFSVSSLTTAAVARADGGSLLQAIEHELADEGIRSVNVAVTNGIVTLTGQTESAWKRNRAEEVTLDHGDVERVDNELTIVSVRSDEWIADEMSRRELASRIYGDSSFFNYSIQPVPPVHIIVDNGRVSLTGVVDTRTRKVRAGQIARQTFGVFSADNALRLAASRTSS